MNKKTQQYLILAVILVAIGAVYYFFIRKPQVVLPTITSGIPTAGMAQQQSAFTPTNFKLDLKSLNDPRLQTMTPPVYPQVQKSELGEQNPFKGQ